MVVRATEIGDILRKQIAGFEQDMTVTNVGTVVEVGDGIARVYGLSQVMASELVEFTKNGTLGLAFNLEEDSVGVIILGEYTDIEEGDEVRATGRIASVPVGDALVGRVVNALGQPIDGKGPIATDKTRPIERIAPGVILRQDVDTAAPDRHQGDRLDDPDRPRPARADHRRPPDRQDRRRPRHDHQPEGSDVICIYVAIGQKQAQVAQAVRVLEEHGAMEHTIVVVASAADPAAAPVHRPLRRHARWARSSWRTGGNALIVYDDLSKHAWAYRQVSLLMRRPPGREAYPGDVFYLHSRLLERAARLNDSLGGGSLTALPIIETQAGDVSAYIPTNVISITDGQIFLEADLFYAGIRPAVNAGISVSRVGGAAQIKAMRQVAGRLRLDLAAYRSLAAFAQFGSDLDPATKAQLDRGARLTEVLKQGQYQPMPVEEQVAILWAATNGYLDDVPVEDVRDFEAEFLENLRTAHPRLAAADRDREGAQRRAHRRRSARRPKTSRPAPSSRSRPQSAAAR